MKQNSNILLCLGILYFLIIVINAKPKPEPKAKKNSEIFDYGCPCGERDVTEEEMRDCKESVIAPAEKKEKQKDERIVGGCDAGKTAWFVSISFEIKISRTARCGGTLINKFWVVTAAHCFCNDLFSCTRSPTGGLIPENDTYSRVHMFIGGDKFQDILMNEVPNKVDPPSKFIFRAAEIILHPRFYSLVNRSGIPSRRDDYDIALVRLDYPVMDEEYGIGILRTMEGEGFSKQTIMPVCLPPPNFKDTEIEAKAVGMGRNNEKNTCLTDSNGPEVFTKCAKQWVGPKESDQEKNNNTNTYKKTHTAWSATSDKEFNCDNQTPPPSSLNKVCVEFNNKLKELHEKAIKKERLTEEDRKLLQVYQISQETLLLPTKNLTKLVAQKINDTHCFSTDPSDDGWCATCDANATVSTPGYCGSEKERLPTTAEIAIPQQNKGWGFCSKSCNIELLADKLKMAKLSILDEETCATMGNVKASGLNDEILTVNPRNELCGAFVSLMNVSMFNYTEKAKNEKEFSLYNDKEEKYKKSGLLRSRRIENNKGLGNYSIRTNMVFGGTDTCQGDSGGPLWTEKDLKTHNGTLKNVAVLIGIVSRGKGCALVNYPGVYTRMKRLWKWVRHYADSEQNYTYRFIGSHRQGMPGAPIEVPITENRTFLISPYCRKLNVTLVNGPTKDEEEKNKGKVKDEEEGEEKEKENEEENEEDDEEKEKEKDDGIDYGDDEEYDEEDTDKEDIEENADEDEKDDDENQNEDEDEIVDLDEDRDEDEDENDDEDENEDEDEDEDKDGDEVDDEDDDVVDDEDDVENEDDEDDDEETEKD